MHTRCLLIALRTREIKRRAKQGEFIYVKKIVFQSSGREILRDIDPFTRFFPFMMKGRNDSAVYFKQQVDVTALRAYINAQNREAASESGDGVMSTLFTAF